ncbi:nucleoside-diphosphate sugar epimerase/dehydratase [Jannaschia sp. W003]|uniref:polysaccharide biosynthesis protein n=1 Tax=Jannaschia sp. W003 TaxID=2867012 RepID=UPI0021A83789|nr:nucleoside-diphosphate sugar epimerase/dehydratase [Jannaschia sp. W003]UWQ21729.1 polysaccharide biosynthesis protein [Jannaschia sp. W003]
MEWVMRALRGMDRSQKANVLLVLDILATPLAMLAAVQILSPGLRADVSLPLWIGLTTLISVAIHRTFRLPHVTLTEFNARAQGWLVAHAAGVGVTSMVVGPAAGLDASPLFHALVAMVSFSLVSLNRALLLRLVTSLYLRDKRRLHVLIYGAGTTGRQLAHALQSNGTIDVVAFVDDNTSLQRHAVAGLPVYAPSHLAELVRRYEIGRVCLAMPSVSPPKQAQIARRLVAMGTEVQSVPSFSQLIGGEPLDQRLEPLDPMRFLPRDELDPALMNVADTYEGRTAMVTGAGGSIGSELCRQLLAARPRRLVMLDVSEFSLYTIHSELATLADRVGVELVPLLGSVADEALMRRILREQGVELVLHAAAYKHVPLVEANVEAGIRNNVFGTRTMARAAVAEGVERFILVSTDKAVRPRGVMGASKRLAEMVVQDLAARAEGTVFAMVRFGNVLGSSGSVVPLFQDQIRRGGPVTVTHPQVCRYFMTIPEAARLVLTAGAMAQGGEVFVLDMGKPVTIAQLARQAIEAAGYAVRDRGNPDGDIEIVYTGLRPGEKLFEELSYDGNLADTAHPKIRCARETRLPELELAACLREIDRALEGGDAEAVRALLADRIEGFAAAAVPAPEEPARPAGHRIAAGTPRGGLESGRPAR